MKRVGVRAKVKRNTALFDTYDVGDGETPEMIANKLYGDPNLHWVILYLNNVTDRYHQWPKPLHSTSYLFLMKSIQPRVECIHHYEITQTSGDTSLKINIGPDNTDHPTATPITNREFEEERQDTLRKIRLLDPTYLDQFVGEFEILIKESIF